MNPEKALKHKKQNPASRVIIVTGASAGIGLSIATRLLSDSGQHLLLLVSRRITSDNEALHKQYGDRVTFAKLDLSDPKQVHEVVQTSQRHFGDLLDALVLNHGTLGKCRRVSDDGMEEWEQTFRVNVFSNVGLIKAAIPMLRKSQGRIVFTSSGAALNAYSSWGAYGASKAAINHLTATLKNEEPEITTIAIRPGVVDTDMQTDIRDTYLQNMDERDQAKFVNVKKDGKLLPPERPGIVIARLAVDASKDFSGKFLSWDDDSLKDFRN